MWTAHYAAKHYKGVFRMLGIIVNSVTLVICLIWSLKIPGFDSFVALGCTISTLLSQIVDKVVHKSKVNQKIKSGNNSINTQIGNINR